MSGAAIPPGSVLRELAETSFRERWPFGVMATGFVGDRVRYVEVGALPGARFGPGWGWATVVRMATV